MGERVRVRVRVRVRESRRSILSLISLNSKRFVKNAETRVLTGLDVKPPTTIAAYV